MNRPSPYLTDELLARYLASTASLPEMERVQAWLDESPEHVQELKAYRKLWESSREAGRHRKGPDTDAAWRSVQARMHGARMHGARMHNAPVSQSDALKPTESQRTAPQAVVKPLPVRRTLPVAIWAAAVVTLLVVAFGWLYFTQNQEPQLVAVSTQDNTYEKTLPDGTKVYLNYNSTLTYPEGLAGDTRSVSLQGEAFFDVAPDADHPFVIDANGTEIRVVGTSFNVKAYDEVVRVEVKTGKVEVKKDHNKVKLMPGEGVEVVKDSLFRPIQAGMNIASYSTQVFEFTETHLDQVVRSLSEGFHADVRLASDRLAQCRITARYERETLDATLSLIAETMNLTVRREGNTYWLEGTGCM